MKGAGATIDKYDYYFGDYYRIAGYFGGQKLANWSKNVIGEF